MTQAEVSDMQMAEFEAGLVDAMHDLAANCMLAVDELDTTTATNLQGRADGLFMQAMVDAAAVAEIDSEIMTAAFDQARVEMGTSQLSASGLAMFDGSYMTSRQQMAMQSQMHQYTDAMSVLNLDAGQSQEFIAAKTTFNSAMLKAREDYQQLFSDPVNPPNQTMIDQAQTDFSAAMQTAMDAFQASDLQIDTMLGQMASNMTGGMMGGEMMSGDLSSMGFGQFQSGIGSAQQNWSIMMVAGSNMPSIATEMAYVPVTDALLKQLSELQTQTTPNLPDVPDWSSLPPDDATLSLLQLQFDLMLTSMIEHQQQDNLGGMMNSLDLVQINTRHMTNNQTIRQGLRRLTDAQSNALMATMGPMHII